MTPTLEQVDGISIDFIRGEAENLSTDDFAREYLCVYRPSRLAHVIDPDLWHGLPPFVPSGDVVLAVDATRDRDAAAVVAAGVAEDYVAIEIVAQRPGVDWLAAYLTDVAVRQSATVVIDAYGPVANLIAPLERAGVNVLAIKVGEVVAAAQTLADLVTTKRLAHLPDPRFTPEAVGRRMIGERWAFSRKGEADISPMIAASYAAWAVEEELLGVPTIH